MNGAAGRRAEAGPAPGNAAVILTCDDADDGPDASPSRMPTKRANRIERRDGNDRAGLAQTGAFDHAPEDATGVRVVDRPRGRDLMLDDVLKDPLRRFRVSTRPTKA